MTPEEMLISHFKGLVDPAPAAPPAAVVEKAIAGAPETRTPVTLRNIFFHHDTHPLVLDFALLKAYGPEWMEWEAETLWTTIKDTFKTDISELAKTKIQTVKTCHVVNSPWTMWQVFEKVVQGLNNNIPRFDLMQAPNLHQLYVGVDIMNTLREEEFSEEVKLYMASAALHENVCFLPPPLDVIQVEVTLPKYKCLDCGNEDSALFNDGTCDACAMTFHPDKTLDMQPHPDVAEKVPGKNLEVILTHNPNDVQARWEAVAHKSLESVDLEETATDVQVAKLMIARDYMNVRRKQLAEQLTAIKSWLGAMV